MNYIDAKVRACIENRTRRKVEKLTLMLLNSGGHSIRLDYEALLDTGDKIKSNVRIQVNVEHG